MAYLVVARHGLSEWNKLGKWQGWTNIDLSDEGYEEARKAGESIKDIKLDEAFVSPLKRVHQTLDEIKKVLNRQDLKTTENRALIERNYGIYTGKNKWQVKEEVGDEEFLKIRRVWDHPIPEGESLKDVYSRLIPYFEQNILPLLKQGKNILLISSGNPIRAIIKYLEDIPDDKISELEVGTGEIYLYEIDTEGKIISKDIRSSNPKKGKI